MTDRDRRTNEVARHLLTTYESQLALLTPGLIGRVAAELGREAPVTARQWPGDLVASTLEFLECVASDDFARIHADGSVFEQIGLEAARGGVDAETLSAGVRLATRRTQALVHRAVITEGVPLGTSSLLDLLSRVLTGGDAVVAAALRGHATAASAPADDEDELARQLAGELIHGESSAAGLAADAGWDDDALVAAVLAPAHSAAQIRREAPCRVGYFARDEDVVLVHPVPKGALATTLRPRLRGHGCVVGPAGPLEEFASSLDLAQRAADLGLGGQQTTFVDDVLFELACTADPSVVRALRRKHLAPLVEETADRDTLLQTLHEWLLHWGRRPETASALAVHPQTVSGRINRAKDLLSDDLDGPRARSELLVLLTALTTMSTRGDDPAPFA